MQHFEPFERNPLAMASPKARQVEDQLMAEVENRRARARQEDLLEDADRSAPPPVDAETGQPVTPHQRGEADPLAGVWPHADAAMQQRMRAAYEDAFPRFWRWLRRKLRIAHQLHSLADSMGARLTVLSGNEREQSRFNAQVAAAMNDQATWLNNMRAALRETNERLAYYERYVPPVKRAKADYDRQRAERVLREADEAALQSAAVVPVIPFDVNGIATEKPSQVRQEIAVDTEATA